MRAGPRRYRILHPVGKGAFGTVYRAQMLGEGGFAKDVALKLMNADLDAPDEAAQRQRDEARMLGLIRHKAILQVDGLVRLNGCWAVVMEYIDGVNLRELLRFGPVPPSCALQIVGEVAGALNVAWEAQGNDGNPLRIIHRDIKPPNIQLTRVGEVKLLDFGVARAEFDTREAETIGLILGTLRYMAPERLDGIDGPKGDMYALGAVLVELLTRKPMLKTSSSPKRHAATLDEILGRVDAALGENHPQLRQLIADCLAYEPDTRPDAKQLERRAWGLIQDYPLPRLSEWAEVRVREAQEHLREHLGDDTLSGETLMEQSESMMLDVTGSRSSHTGIDAATGLIGFSVAGLLLLGAVALALLAILLGLALSRPEAATRVGQIERIAVPEVETGGNDYPVVYRMREDGTLEQDEIPEPTPLPRPVRPSPRPDPTPLPKPTPPPKPVVQPEAPKPVAAEVNSSGMGTSAMGTVRVAGAQTGVQLRGPRGTFDVPGEVPDGVYDVIFNGVQALKSVRVRRAGTLNLKCDPGFGICTQL